MLLFSMHAWVVETQCDDAKACHMKTNSLLQHRIQNAPVMGAEVQTVSEDSETQSLIGELEAKSQPASDPDEEVLSRVQPFTMVQDDHMRLLLDAVRQVNQNLVEGDFVEAGVWKGGASMAMALAQLRDPADDIQRQLWLYDTFEGLPAPSSSHDDPRAKDIFEKLEAGTLSEQEQEDHAVEDGKWNYGPEDEVRANMNSTGFAADRIHLIRGKVEDTLVQTANLPEKIAILRLDTDWYDSTKAELTQLLPRLQPGGLLIIDDYCSWSGSKEACDEILSDKSWWNERPDARDQKVGNHSLSTVCAYAWVA